MKEKINVDKLVKELNKGDVTEQVAVLKFLKEQVAQKLQAKQEELAALNQSLQVFAFVINVVASSYAQYVGNGGLPVTICIVD